MNENYKLTDHGSIIRLSDCALIPPDEANSDYQRYLQWRDGWTENPIVGYEDQAVTVGGEVSVVSVPIYGDPIVHPPHTPEPADPAPPVVITEVTMRQARLALLAAGKLTTVDAAINSLPSPQKEAAQIEWEYSNSLQRNNPLVQTLGPVLGVDMDALFLTASKL